MSDDSNFSKTWSLVLGIIQIMDGLICMMLGVVMAFDADSLGAFSCIYVWGALLCVMAGGLTVAAGKSDSSSVACSSFCFCVIAALSSLTGTILYSIDAAGSSVHCEDYPANSSFPSSICSTYQIRMKGCSGVLIVFSLLELFVSVTAAVAIFQNDQEGEDSDQ